MVPSAHHCDGNFDTCSVRSMAATRPLMSSVAVAGRLLQASHTGLTEN